MYATSEILWFDCCSLKDLLLTNGQSFTFLGQKRCFEKCLSDVYCFVLALAFSRPFDFPIGIIKLSKNSWSRRYHFIINNNLVIIFLI